MRFFSCLLQSCSHNRWVTMVFSFQIVSLQPAFHSESSLAQQSINWKLAVRGIFKRKVNCTKRLKVESLLLKALIAAPYYKWFVTKSKLYWHIYEQQKCEEKELCHSVKWNFIQRILTPWPEFVEWWLGLFSKYFGVPTFKICHVGKTEV